MNIHAILFPTDFSESSDAALKYASSLAAETGAKLFIVHVADNTPAYFAGYGGFAGVPDLPSKFEEEMRAMLEQVQPTLPQVEFERRYLAGSPVSALVDFADREKMDLIIMATHGRSGLSRVLMGSVAEGVLRRANCPVLTLKNPQADEIDADESGKDSQKKHSAKPTKFSLH